MQFILAFKAGQLGLIVRFLLKQIGSICWHFGTKKKKVFI